MKTSDLVILVADAISESGQLVCKKLAAAGHVVFGGYEAPAPECLKYAASITPLPPWAGANSQAMEANTASNAQESRARWLSSWRAVNSIH